jgi:hypothetical protein
MKSIALVVLLLVVCSAVQPKNMRLRSVRKQKTLTRCSGECIPATTAEGIDAECPPGTIGSSGNGCDVPTPTCCDPDSTSDYQSEEVCTSAPTEAASAPTCKFTGSTAVCLGADDTDCKKCLGTYDRACVAEWAVYIGAKYNAVPVKYSQPKRQFGIEGISFSDCSAFVTTVLDAAGYKCFTDALQYKTTLFYRDVTRKLVTKLPDCGGYHLESPQVGDLVMWEKGTTGHIALVVEVGTEGIRWAGMGSSGVAGFTPATTFWKYDAATANDGNTNMQKHGLGGPAGWAKAGGFFSPLKAAVGAQPSTDAPPANQEPPQEAPAESPAE